MYNICLCLRILAFYSLKRDSKYWFKKTWCNTSLSDWIKQHFLLQSSAMFWLKKPSYPQDPTLHLVYKWMCPHRASGGPEASRCVSMSQTSNRTSAHRRETNARRCNRCSSGCQGEYTGSYPTHSPARWCETWHQTFHPHCEESRGRYF